MSNKLNSEIFSDTSNLLLSEHSIDLLGTHSHVEHQSIIDIKNEIQSQIKNYPDCIDKKSGYFADPSSLLNKISIFNENEKVKVSGIISEIQSLCNENDINLLQGQIDFCKSEKAHSEKTEKGYLADLLSYRFEHLFLEKKVLSIRSFKYFLVMFFLNFIVVLLGQVFQNQVFFTGLSFITIVVTGAVAAMYYRRKMQLSRLMSYQSNQAKDNHLPVESISSSDITNARSFKSLFDTLFITEINTVQNKIKAKNKTIQSYEKTLKDYRAHIQKLNNDQEKNEKTLLDLQNRFRDKIELLINSIPRIMINMDQILNVRHPVNEGYFWNSDSISDLKLQTMFPDYISIGSYQTESGKNVLPASIPFMTEDTLFISCDERSKNAAVRFMNNHILKINSLLLDKCKFSFYDPANYGSNFPISNKVNHRQIDAGNYRFFEEIEIDISRIIKSYGLSETNTFKHNESEFFIEEQAEFIFLAQFPHGYDYNVLENILKIGRVGHIAAKFLVVMINHKGDSEEQIEQIMSLRRTLVSLNKTYLHNFSFHNDRMIFCPDTDEDKNLEDQILNKIKQYKPKSNHIQFNHIHKTGLREIWKEKSSSFIETPIGLGRRKEPVSIWFGEKPEEGKTCSHGILAATTGSGKSVFFHSVIMGLATRYNPLELKLYLIDGKSGVEFQYYKNLPHANVVSLNTQPELAVSVIEEIKAELDRRMDFFQEKGVQNLQGFRASVKNAVPRILAVIDEYQILFDNDDENHNRSVSADLKYIAEKGRAAGIHLLLGSQKFRVSKMYNKDEIFSNLHLHIALKMNKQDIDLLSEFGDEGKDLISQCNTPGKAVINDNGGMDGSNAITRVAFTGESDISQLTGLFNRRLKDKKLLGDKRVFNGTEQPLFSENTQVRKLLTFRRILNGAEMEKLSKMPLHRGGFNSSSWYRAEKPVISWFGQKISVYGEASITLKRRADENIIIVGKNNQARIGMISSFLSSMQFNLGSGKINLFVIDKTMPGTPWNISLVNVYKTLLIPSGIVKQLVNANKKDHMKSIQYLYNKLKDDGGNETNILLLIDADRISDLCQRTDSYGMADQSENGKKLQAIIKDGSSRGIYTVMSFESVKAMEKIISKNDLEYFNHRVALQMPLNDSIKFIDRKDASQLNSEFKTPVRALINDMEHETVNVFKPYCVSDAFDRDIDRYTGYINKMRGNK